MSLHLETVVSARGVQLTLDVAQGETLALLGPNGVGKSTALGVIAGLLQPDRGRVEVGGRVLTDTEAGVRVPVHDRGVALLAQEPLLFPHLSARDNVAFGPRASGASRTAARARAQELLDALGVGDLAARRPAELSGGQAQRVAVARALAVEPRLLLLDEPMAALDVDVAPALRRTLRSVLADVTVVLVTHDPLDALLLADRVAVLEGGRVAEEGPARDVLARPRTAFAGRLAGLNLVHGTWSDGVVRRPDGGQVAGVLVSETVDGAEVAASFRPAAVAVYRTPVTGSPRNSFAVRLDDVQPLGSDLVRVRGGGIAADVTVQAAAELDLAPGAEVTFAVKAAEVVVYPL